MTSFSHPQFFLVYLEEKVIKISLSQITYFVFEGQKVIGLTTFSIVVIYDFNMN